MKKKVKEVTKSWVRLDDIDKSDPATEITLASVIQFRNGLGKKMLASKGKPQTMADTLTYRAMLDLDHLARLMDSENRRSRMEMTYQIVIKPTDKKSAKKMAKWVKT